MDNTLRQFIRILLEKEEESDENLLTEPDETDGRDEREASFGGVAGVSTPLGRGPHYPSTKIGKSDK
jgi:hypothetical protein